MSESSNQAALLREVQQHIRKLETATSGVGVARNHLKQSSSEVKSDIQTTMTHQLRILRERELYLLKQVDLAEQAKDMALQDQEDQLHETLGGLRNILEMGSGMENMEDHVQGTLDRLKKQSLVPTETPHIAFKANLPTLHDAINNFGSIDVQRMPVSALFGDEPSSASLPRPFEDYDDEEHHVLHRSVRDSNPGTQQISMMIPHLSIKPEDWLFMPADQLQPQAAVKSPSQTVGAMFPPFISENLGERLETHNVMSRSCSSAASIHQWLCDIQGQGDVEEAEGEFEVISPTSCRPDASTKGSSIDVLSMEETQPMFFSATDEICGNMGSMIITPLVPAVPHQPSYFEQISADNPSRWLLNTAVPEASSTYCNEILRYFREISNDTRDWLHKYQEKVEEPAEPCKLSGPCLITAKNVDIENLDELFCVQDSLFGYFKEMKSDARNWLLDRKDEDQDVDEADIEGVMLSVCKANESCETFQDCLFDENCCVMLETKPIKEEENDDDNKPMIKDKKQQNVWLMTDHQTGFWPQTTEPATVFPPFVHRSEIHDWLMKSRVPPVDGFKPFSGVFGEIPSSPDNQWLASEHESIATKHSLQDLTCCWSAKFKHKPVKVDPVEIRSQHSVQNKWLLSGSPPVPTVSSSEVFKEARLDGDDKNKTVSWLLKPKQEGQCHKDNKWVLPTKQSELPECEDEPGVESQTMQNEVWFSCFKKEALDKNVWLASSEPLIN